MMPDIMRGAQLIHDECDLQQSSPYLAGDFHLSSGKNRPEADLHLLQ
jgi:hypothetical protein